MKIKKQVDHLATLPLHYLKNDGYSKYVFHRYNHLVGFFFAMLLKAMLAHYPPTTKYQTKGLPSVIDLLLGIHVGTFILVITCTEALASYVAKGQLHTSYPICTHHSTFVED